MWCYILRKIHGILNKVILHKRNFDKKLKKRKKIKKKIKKRKKKTVLFQYKKQKNKKNMFFTTL